MIKKTYLLLFFFHFLSLVLVAQYYSTGQDPASIKWRIIKSEKFKLVYPEGFEKKAQYLGNIFELVTAKEIKTLKAKVPRMPVVLHTSTSQSNGVTVWAPKRIELFTSPPQETYAEEWLEQLAIHEYRHAVQVSKMNQGFTKGLSIILGEQAIGAILGLFIPSWFLEGDAVCTETALSSTGRGRSSVFENILRAQLLEKKIYSYDKAVLGSYKHFTPDAYALGYPIVACSRKIYGTRLWNTALDRTAKLPFMVVPFSSGIHSETGLTKVKFYKKILSELTADWMFQQKRTRLSEFTRITHPDEKNYTSFRYPSYINDSVIVAKTKSMDDPDQIVFVNKNNSQEKRILITGRTSDDWISTGSGLILWTEIRNDNRWQNRTYSVIRSHQLKTKRTGDLTRKSRYFVPAISPDGKIISAVKIDLENNHSIDILDASSGTVLHHFPLRQFIQVLTPCWSPDGKSLVFIALTPIGKSLMRIDLPDGNISVLTPYSFIDISGPVTFYKNYLFFCADYSGIQNIYAMNILSQKIFQVTSSRFSACDPSSSSANNLLTYSDYTSDGWSLCETHIDTTKWIPLAKVMNQSIHLYDSIVQQEKSNLQKQILEKKLYNVFNDDEYEGQPGTSFPTLFKSKKYSKLLNLFNPHSWAPLSIDATNMSILPGVSVQSQNILSTMIAGAGWEYNTNEHTGKFFANLSYQGLYPVFDLQFDIGNRSSYYLQDGIKTRFTWQETSTGITASIPWNLSRGKFSRSLIPYFGFSLINIRHNSTTPELFISGNLMTLNYKIRFSQSVRSSMRDLFPRWGQSLFIEFRNSPFEGMNMGSILGAQADLYFPGILKHHGIWSSVGYQLKAQATQNVYSFSDIIRFPRGFTDIDEEQVLSVGLNYKFPLFYPDFSAGSVIFFKRFNLNLFYDFAKGRTGMAFELFQSTGIELTSDMHFLRFPFPIELGVRSIYFPMTGTWGWEFIYSVF